MKKLIFLFIAIFCIANTNIYGVEQSLMEKNAHQNVATAVSYTGWLTVAAPNIGNIYDDESNVTVTPNGNNTVTFDMNITLLGFFTGSVHIANVNMTETNVTPNATSSVNINGIDYTVKFQSGTITNNKCDLNIIVESTPLGDLSIVFTSYPMPTY